MIKIATYHWNWIVLVVIIFITVAVTTRPAFRQQSNMVVIRLLGIGGLAILNRLKHALPKTFPMHG